MTTRPAENLRPPRRALKLAYVVSMTHGLHRFVFREIRELLSMGLSIHLFPTKVGQGPYAPPTGTILHRAMPRQVLGSHVWWLVRDPARYLSVLLESVQHSAPADFVLAGFVAKETVDLDLDLIHCHFGDHKLFIGYLAARLSGRPVTATIHAYELYNNPNPKLFRKVLQQIQRVVTIAEYNRSVLEEYWGMSPERIAVIPLFADLPAIRNARGHLQPGKVVILSVARFVEKKGHRTLFRALARLPPSFEAWLVGSGPINVKAVAATEGVANRVRVFEGVSDDELDRLYRSASLFCLPSETSPEGDREGLPVALMEAMAYELPVVATRHAGIPELVEEVLVREGDVGALAKALADLGADPGLRERQGRRNREIIEARYSRRNVLLLKSLFEGIVNDLT